jgi:molybdate transport system permease protein
MIRSDKPFLIGLALLGGLYVALILAMIGADVWYLVALSTGSTPAAASARSGLWKALTSEEIRYAIGLSLKASSASALLSVLVAVPAGYLLSRYSFPGRRLLDAVIDIPIVLPPLVIGLSLLILFRSVRSIPFSKGSVVLAQFAVAAAFAVRTMRVTFDELGSRSEQVARTLGCSRSQAFLRVVLPESRHGMVAAFTMAWARSLGEFGPVLVFSGATRMKTEVLSTSVFLELSIGRLDAAVAVSLLMVVVSIATLVIIRALGSGPSLTRGLQP